MSAQLELSDKWRQRLRDLPESQMGSQHIDVVLDTGEVILNLSVFNGRYLQLEGKTFTEKAIIDIKTHGPNKRG
jgi:hypothetical protein